MFMSLNSMRICYLVFLVIPLLGFSQKQNTRSDTLTYKYYYIKGDSIPKTSISLEPIVLLPTLHFKNRDEYRQYLILKRKTIKVFPYAKLAAERLETMYERLESIKKKRHKRVYIRRMQKYIDGKFSEELKKLTRTEGQILIKLIHRQTGKTTFALIKELRSGWKAFWFNNTASLFDLSLKQEYSPKTDKEDFFIESILQHSFQNGELEAQNDALNLDFFSLAAYWEIQNKTEK